MRRCLFNSIRPENEAYNRRPDDGSIGKNEDHMGRFRSTVREGDHIITGRKGNLYDHHGIYMGDQIVAHVRKRHGDSSYLCEKCADSTTERLAPTYSCVDCFRLDHPCYIIRYREPGQWRNVSFFSSSSKKPKNAFYGYKSNKLYAEWCKDGRYGYFEISKRRCIENGINIEDLIKLSRFSSSKSAEQVKKTARQNYIYKYNLLVDNCEDFAVFCKTDRHRSMQAEKRMWKPLYMVVKGMHQWNDRRKGRTILRKCLASFPPGEPADHEMVAPAEVVSAPVEAIVDMPVEVVAVDNLEVGLRVDYPQEDEDPIIVTQEVVRVLEAQEDPTLDKQDKSLMLEVEKPEYKGSSSVMASIIRRFATFKESCRNTRLHYQTAKIPGLLVVILFILSERHSTIYPQSSLPVIACLISLLTLRSRAPVIPYLISLLTLRSSAPSGFIFIYHVIACYYSAMYYSA